MPVKIRDDAVGKDDCTSRISTGSAWILASSVVHRGTKTELMLQEMICESKHTHFGF